MKKYGYLSAIPLSFFSADLYRDVARNWKANVLLYLLLLVAVCSMLASVRFAEIMVDTTKNTLRGESATNFFSQIPYVTIKNGEIQTPEKRPYFIKDKEGRVIMIIDTTGKYNNVKEANVDYIITSHGYLYRSKSNEQKELLLSTNVNKEIKIKQGGEFEVDGKSYNIEKFLGSHTIFLFLFLLISLFSSLFSFIYILIQAALYSILGELFLVFSKIPLTYGQVFRLAIFALTPGTVIWELFDFFKITFPYEGMLYFMLSMAYLIFGIRANKE